MPPITDGALLRLMTWMSPAFPVGAYSYSHGIEAAVERGLITDAVGLRAWIDAILRHGSGRCDAILVYAAWQAERARDDVRLAETLAWADAFRATFEMALESAAQGRAFLDGVRAAWPHPRLDALADLAADLKRPPSYPLVAGVAIAAAGIDISAGLVAFVHAFAANLVSAGTRLIPLGQSDALRVLAGLEATIRAVAQDAQGLGLADLGTATWMVDWTSARHETQYTRLFRS
ncbi:MAG: urease accessory protein UreF [Rhodospirillales bacterium]|nr:urease accessory protein UreF [Rhodospirillales bacterium]